MSKPPPYDPPSNPYFSDPDVILMLEFQKGQKASFEKLMERNYKKVFNFIYRFVGNSQMAEDLAQETFLKIYHAAVSYKPASKFLTWVYQIAKNISLNELRTRKHAMVSFDQPTVTGGDDFKKEYPDPQAANPFQEMTQKETLETIRRAIAGLPENQRLAVVLRRYENSSYEEIAVILKCSVKAVKSLLNRAKENLKDKLSGLER